MNCNEIKDLISLYIDHELSEEEAKKIKEHIESCDECKKEFESYKQMVNILKDLPDEEPPKGYCKRLHEKLLNTIPQKRTNKVINVISNKKLLKYAGIAAAFVVVFLTLVYPNLRMGSSSKSEMSQSSENSYDMATTEQSPSAPPMLNNGSYGESGMVSDAAKSAEQEARGIVTTSSDKKMKIIKSSGISTQTENYDQFISDLVLKIKAMGGFVEQNNSNVYNVYENKKLKYGYLTLRIPEDKFYEIISYIEEFSEVNQKNISEVDKTKEYYEKDNQIKNLEAQEAKLRELFAKATTVQDMITIENELRRIRTEIDSLNLSLKDIDDRASMSTITLEVQEVLPPNFNISDSDNVWERAKEGFINTVNALVDLTENIVVSIISLSPILIPFTIILIIFVVKIRKNNKNNIIK